MRLHRLLFVKWDGSTDEYSFIVYPGQDETVAEALDTAVREVTKLGDSVPFAKAALGNLHIARIKDGLSDAFPMQFDLDFAAGTRGVVDPRRAETAPFIARGWDYLPDSTALGRDLGGLDAEWVSHEMRGVHNVSLLLTGPGSRYFFQAEFDPERYAVLEPELLDALDALSPDTVDEFTATWLGWGGTVE